MRVSSRFLWYSDEKVICHNIIFYIHLYKFWTNPQIQGPNSFSQEYLKIDEKSMLLVYGFSPFIYLFKGDKWFREGTDSKIRTQTTMVWKSVKYSSLSSPQILHRSLTDLALWSAFQCWIRITETKPGVRKWLLQRHRCLEVVWVRGDCHSRLKEYF